MCRTNQPDGAEYARVRIRRRENFIKNRPKPYDPIRMTPTDEDWLLLLGGEKTNGNLISMNRRPHQGSTDGANQNEISPRTARHQADGQEPAT